MHVASSRLARVRAFELSPARFFAVALAQVGALWLIVGTGAAVRLTDSGLGCRHWPGCEKGQPLPEKDYHAVIEFSNRLVGGLVIATTLLTWLAATRTPGLPRRARRLALAIFLGGFLQAPLGLATVRSDLHWPLVMAHLLLSIALLAGAVVVAIEARAVTEGRAAPWLPLELRRLVVGSVAALGVLVVSGAFATAAGPHSGGGEHIDRFASLDATVYAHAAVVAVFGIGFLFSLGYLAARRHEAPRLFRLGVLVLLLLGLQMGLGELQWRTHLPWELVLVHVALAAAVWALAVAFAVLVSRPLRSFAPSVD